MRLFLEDVCIHARICICWQLDISFFIFQSGLCFADDTLPNLAWLFWGYFCLQLEADDTKYGQGLKIGALSPY